MSERRSIHDKLFRAVVVMGAALGAAACYEHGKSPPNDGRVADTSKPPGDGGLTDSTPVDVIAIL